MIALSPRDRGRQPIADIVEFVNVLLDEQHVMLAEEIERAALVGEPDRDLAHIAGILAAAVGEILDGDLGDRGRLVALHLAFLKYCRSVI